MVVVDTVDAVESNALPNKRYFRTRGSNSLRFESSNAARVHMMRTPAVQICFVVADSVLYVAYSLDSIAYTLSVRKEAFSRSIGEDYWAPQTPHGTTVR